MKQVFLFLLSLHTLFSCSAQQQVEEAVLPKGYFQFPMSPGVTTSLSGSYGDIRVNHFHSGLDIRTGGAEGKPIYSIADGYVSRINISTGGYGNALYITHPNGYTSLYAHLSEFSPKVKQYLLEQQYARQRFQIDFQLEPNQISVRKGELVALSGNSGGSGGPHLHFEIRNQQENTIDPVLFGFSEVVDTKSPILEVVTLTPMTIDSRVNGEYKTQSFFPTVVNGRYTLPNRITATGKIGVSVHAYDKNNNSPFRLGVTSIQMRADGVPQFAFTLREMPFDDKVDLNVHTNYEALVSGGRKFHKCYVDEGNRMPFYETNEWAGQIAMDEKKRDIAVRLTDSHKNWSMLQFSLEPEAKFSSPLNVNPTFIGTPSITYGLLHDVLRIEVTNADPATNAATVFFDQTQKLIPLTYEKAGKKVFLYPLSNGLPRSVQVENSIISLPYNLAVSPQMPVVKKQTFSVDFTNSLYRPLYLTTQDTGSSLILDKDIYPLKGNFTVQWQPSFPIVSPKTTVFLMGKKPKFVSSTNNNGLITFKGKELGTYQLMTDEIAPTIVARVVSPQNLRFVISDNLSGIKEIKCYVNGQWVLMEYEPKQNVIWSEKLDESQPFSGLVQLYVTDNCGNTAIFERNLP